MKSDKMFFVHLPSGEELKLDDSIPAADQMEVEETSNAAGAPAITEFSSDSISGAVEPDAKRQKTDEMVE